MRARHALALTYGNSIEIGTDILLRTTLLGINRSYEVVCMKNSVSGNHRFLNERSARYLPIFRTQPYDVEMLVGWFGVKFYPYSVHLSGRDFK